MALEKAQRLAAREPARGVPGLCGEDAVVTRERVGVAADRGVGEAELAAAVDVVGLARQCLLEHRDRFGRAAGANARRAEIGKGRRTVRDELERALEACRGAGEVALREARVAVEEERLGAFEHGVVHRAIFASRAPGAAAA